MGIHLSTGLQKVIDTVEQYTYKTRRNLLCLQRRRIDKKRDVQFKMGFRRRRPSSSLSASPLARKPDLLRLVQHSLPGGIVGHFWEA